MSNNYALSKLGATSARSPGNRKPFRFLDLPPELRNMVYAYALRYDFCRDYFSYKSRFMIVRYQDTRTEAGHYRALVTSCRQIYLETKTLLITLNTFVIHRFELKEFSRARVIDPTRLAAVRHVKLWVPLVHSYATRRYHGAHRYMGAFDHLFWMLRRLKGLKRLTLELRHKDRSVSEEMSRHVARLRRDAGEVFAEEMPGLQVDVQLVSTCTWPC